VVAASMKPPPKKVGTNREDEVKDVVPG